MADSVYKQEHVTDNNTSNVSERDADTSRQREFVDAATDCSLQLNDSDVSTASVDSASDVALKLLEDMHRNREENSKKSPAGVTSGEVHAETSKHRAKRKRKRDSPCRANSDLPHKKKRNKKEKKEHKKPIRVKLLNVERVEEDEDVDDHDAGQGSGDEQPADGGAHGEEAVVYTCEECGKEFPCANVLTRHKRKHSTHVFHCDECAADFTDPAAYKRHAVVVHQVRSPFTCTHPGCAYRSDRLSNVEKHVSIHSPTHAFSCTRCGRTFAQDAGLRSHLLSCTESRSFLCDLCGAAFNHLQSMRSHRRVHTGERPYRCTDCSSTFADHRNYKRHRRIHDNAFPYACILCGKRFRHSNSLKSHLGTHGIMTKPTSV